MNIKRVHIFIVVILILISILLYIGNNYITTSEYKVKLNNLPSSFEGFRIVQLSDVHNKMFGAEQNKLVNEIKEQNPDIIVITGDLIDRRRYGSKDNALKLLEKIINIAPVYFVTGNHEWWSNKYESELYDEIKSYGVKILSNEKIELIKGKEKINLIGLDDIAKYYKEKSKPYESFIAYANVNETLKALNKTIDDSDIKILLSHRPDLIDIYEKNKVDVVLSGHTHGGQVRIPFIGGLIAPSQGFFPDFDGGMYKRAEMILIVSRGLGNSLGPFRINNFPEIVTLILTN